jgi:hypothetical protein
VFNSSVFFSFSKMFVYLSLCYVESNSFSFSKNSFNPCDSLNFFFILFVIHELKLDFQA